MGVYALQDLQAEFGCNRLVAFQIAQLLVRRGLFKFCETNCFSIYGSLRMSKEFYSIRLHITSGQHWHLLTVPIEVYCDNGLLVDYLAKEHKIHSIDSITVL